MSRQRLVMGNWKMNGNLATVHALLQHLKSMQVPKDAQVAVFPPFVYLEKACWELRHSAVQFGAQNVSAHENGAYTGEVSASMLKDLSCHYVLIGHSERRQLFGETNAIVANKFLRAVAAGLKVVLCVGETETERHKKLTEQVVLAQLESVLNLPVAKAHLDQIVVAYEPVWAIGTGLTASPVQAQEVHQLLRETLTAYDKRAAHIPIIYGGSVKAANAKELFAMPDIDGALVGGASLDAQEFIQICHLVI